MLIPEIKLITTGGRTIDGSKTNDNNLNGKTAAWNFLCKDPTIKINLEFIFSKDSRDIGINDYNLIISTINKSSEKFIIITHGYLRIIETSQYLKEHLHSKDKLVLITSAWTNFDETLSDGPKNLEYAISMIKSDISAGLYICMDQKLWDPYKTKLDITELGRHHLVQTSY